jgi:Tol biopolymer transport system component/predicted Ser/Thr protein kinase
MIAAGTRLGPYEVIAPLGAGGMGEVWKARDTRLERSVAIKVLPAAVAQNAQLKVRFEREAKTISQLNHPNICTLYDVGDDYLVMELLEGETLADRVARGPLPISETLRIGAQIAEALDRAHRAGIVHRDLKPGNVMLTKTGAKLLDFGLAKSGAFEITNDGATLQKSLTAEGTILGTFQYMAPEQLEGVEADPRTDIFALGAVLYEMASGRRAFDGKTRTSLIAAIVGSDPPPIAQLQPMTPPALEHVIRKCLSKEPDDRWQSAHDIAEELRWINEAGSQAGVPAIARRSRARRWLAWSAVALALAIAATAITAFVMRRAPRDPRFTFSLAVPPHAPYSFIRFPTLSPDGDRIVFIGAGEKESRLWVRSVDSADAKPLPGTDGAEMPFWSPDGANIGFFAGGKVKRVPAAGGPPQIICDAAAPWGAAWAPDDTIILNRLAIGPLERVPASGGTPKPLTKMLPADEGHRWPVILPDGDHFLFLADASLAENHRLRIGSLKSGEAHDLTQVVSSIGYVAPYALFVRGGSLIAQRLDLSKPALVGEPRVITEHVAQNWDNHHYDFSASANGRLLYRSANPDASLVWVDRAGIRQQVALSPRRIGVFNIAPNHRTVAFEQLDADGRGDDIWLLDGARGVATRFTSNSASEIGPVWSPDGKSLAYGSLQSGLGDAYVADVTNPATAKLLAKAPGGTTPTSWSPDGQWVLLWTTSADDASIELVSTRTGERKPYINTPFLEYDGRFSPDGKWVTYVSAESGQAEVYIEEFPTHAQRRQLSTAGGDYPRWRGDSQELYYMQPGGALMAVDLTAESAAPKALFTTAARAYDLAPDGQRFLLAEPVDDVRATPHTFVSGFFNDEKPRP